MQRKITLAILSTVVVLGTALLAQAPAPQREIAITFDDLPFGGPNVGLARSRAANEAILATLRKGQTPAVGLVNESKLYVPGEIDERTALLEMWLDAGAELGNHTFSHPSLYETPLATFQEDVVRGETVTRWLLEKRGQKLRWFRHPFLRTGPSLEVRSSFEKFLADRGYTVAPVTVENSDYVFSAAYSRAKTQGNQELMRRLGEEYLRFTEAQLDFWESVSQELLGRPMKHVLLLHVNEINADYFDEVLELMRRRGYRVVRLEEALRDEAYRLPDTYAGRAGVSWLYRWAVSKGVKIDWSKEPEPPASVQELYREAQSAAR
ncbi:MAG TPA: polysaccharide deacetylase family protein [Thermoanaerobaculia bacterium]|nr:polysaccharide deacetylase family protein [Thermoanaerobaculia bacterium]